MAFSKARDRTTAHSLWTHAHDVLSGVTSAICRRKVQACCGMVNRGLAVLGEKVFMATLDAHVIALDRKTGNVIWDVEAADYR